MEFIMIFRNRKVNSFLSAILSLVRTLITILTDFIKLIGEYIVELTITALIIGIALIIGGAIGYSDQKEKITEETLTQLINDDVSDVVGTIKLLPSLNEKQCGKGASFSISSAVERGVPQIGLESAYCIRVMHYRFDVDRFKNSINFPKIQMFIVNQIRNHFIVEHGLAYTLAITEDSSDIFSSTGIEIPILIYNISRYKETIVCVGTHSDNTCDTFNHQDNPLDNIILNEPQFMELVTTDVSK